MPAPGLPRKDTVATQKGEWGTPTTLFGLLDSRYHFTMDLAATPDNTKCYKFYAKGAERLFTITKDGTDYHCMGDLFNAAYVPTCESLFINPDYSRGIIDQMMQRCVILSEGYQNRVVALVPFCGSPWFKTYAMAAAEIQIIGRIKYVGYDTSGNLIDGSPGFDSCIVLFEPGNHNHVLSNFIWDKSLDFKIPKIRKKTLKLKGKSWEEVQDGVDQEETFERVRDSPV